MRRTLDSHSRQAGAFLALGPWIPVCAGPARPRCLAGWPPAVADGSDGTADRRGYGLRLSSSLLGKGFDGHEAQPVAGGLVAVDDPTECKLAYLAVVSHPAAETVAHLIDKFLQ